MTLEEANHSMANGDNGPVMALYSRRPDVALANPLGPPIVGYDRISEESTRVAARFKQGTVSFDEVSRFASHDFAWTVGFERIQAILVTNGEPVSRELRVTSIFRRESRAWKIALRHADTIGTALPATSG